MRIATVAFLLALTQTAPNHPAPPIPRELAKDVYLLTGSVPADRGPDGNTVIFVAPEGLVVIDTGRHPWQSDGILEFARSRETPITVIVNTHWHLDHSSGNRRLKAAYPEAKVYTTTAVNRALAPGGFLAKNAAAARERTADPNASAVSKEEREFFLATMDAADMLRPDVPVERSSSLKFAGRTLAVHVARNAVTDADIWIYDEATGVAVIGDLSTVPAPFFETACPAKWRVALDEVWATPFRLAVPGHGKPMTRDEFDTYRGAFGRFIACVGTENAAATCAAGWTKDVTPLLEGDVSQANEYASYYVDFLRKNGGNSPECQQK
jgi:glyoxylase-like metal-dependent hydrolase (beta-lactamase superfamily II)